MMALVGLVLIASAACQPRTYVVRVAKISQPDGRPPVDRGLTLIGGRYVTFSGAPLLVEFEATGFECGDQDIEFMVTYTYRKVRPTNFLEDPSLYVMEGFMTTTTIVAESCAAFWVSPTLRDGIHTVGILAFDGAGAQSPWFYVTIIKNNDREGISYFPGGNQYPSQKSEEPPVSRDPSIIIDNPDQTITIGRSPVQYVDIHFHTNYPFIVEYFLVEWSFTSQAGCTCASSAIVYPTGLNQGFYRLDMSSVFASQWERPEYTACNCSLVPGEFVVRISCKTAEGLGVASAVTITLS
jgi:hypothetical protein